ncbi:MAG: hypothetical protein U1G07_13070 [Verrucomicrobiota bacterium]
MAFFRAARAPRLLTFVLLALVSWLANGEAQTVQLLSRARTSAPVEVGSSFSGNATLSGDGRRVVFESQAGNLTTNEPAQGVLGYYVNVYVRDLASGTTTLVSAKQNGNKGGHGDSSGPVISRDGRYVVFQSEADDLVAGDTNQSSDIFIRDLETSQTKLVSWNAAGSAPGNGPSTGPAMSPDGRFVVFESEADDLTAGDGNDIQDVFLRDLEAGKTTLVSVGASDSNPTVGVYSAGPSLSEDGSVVTFVSTALYPPLGLTDRTPRVFWRDVSQAAPSFVTQAMMAEAAQAVGVNLPIVASYSPSISADGKTIAFKTPPAGIPQGRAFVFLLDIPSGKAEVISTNAYALDAETPDEGGPLLSPDGQKVLFTGLVNDVSQVYLWDRVSKETVLISANGEGKPATGNSSAAVMGSDGLSIAFVSDALDLVAGVTNRTFQVYQRDLATETTHLVSADPTGQPTATVENTVPSMSEDGRLIAFDAPDGTLVSNDRNRAVDVFVLRLASNRVELVSARHPSLTPLTGIGTSQIRGSLSSDGRRGLIVSSVDGLAEADENGLTDVFSFELASAQGVRLITSATNGSSANSVSHDPILTTDGRFAVFTSSASDLTTLTDTNNVDDLFWTDLEHGAIKLITAATDGQASAAFPSPSAATRYPSGWASISGDGRYVAFLSSAANLADPATPISPRQNVFRRDVTTDSTVRIDFGDVSSPQISPDGQRVLYWKRPSPAVAPAQLMLWEANSKTNRMILEWAGLLNADNSPLSLAADWSVAVFETGVMGSRVKSIRWVRLTDGSSGSVTALADGTETTNTLPTEPTIAANGRYVVFASQEARYSPLDLNNAKDIYVRDLQSGTLALVTVNASGTAAGNGPSFHPAISADGRYVAFQSDAGDLVPSDHNNASDIFRRDLEAKNTLLLSANPAGESGNAASTQPVMSPSGQTIVFNSVASDLVPGDYNQTIDVFAVDLGGPTLGSFGIENGQIGFAFAAQSGKHYRIERSDDLASGTWASVEEVTGTGASISFRYALDGQQRFYRVVLLPN